MFDSQYQIVNGTWQSFERDLCRLLLYEGFSNVRLVGQTGDHGADVTASKVGKRWLFQAKHGYVNVVCAVDIFNEGIDVPDVNILVFQRVTHSRRIFIQQLGRGLRVSEGKEKVIVLDFVSDIRRFAAGISLKDSLEPHSPTPTRIDLPNKVTFMKVGGEDPQTETFLRQWLDDVVAIEESNEDDSVLRYPPLLPGGKQ